MNWFSGYSSRKQSVKPNRRQPVILPPTLLWHDHSLQGRRGAGGGAGGSSQYAVAAPALWWWWCIMWWWFRWFKWFKWFKWLTGECSLLGGVGIPVALWQTYHSDRLVVPGADCWWEIDEVKGLCCWWMDEAVLPEGGLFGWWWWWWLCWSGDVVPAPAELPPVAETLMDAAEELLESLPSLS